MLSQEREREKAERERRRLEKERWTENGGDGMDVDAEEDDVPSCMISFLGCLNRIVRLNGIVDASIEAPPSLMPQRHYCDITGLEV